MAPSSAPFLIKKSDRIEKKFSVDTSHVVPGQYALSFVIYEIGAYGTDRNIDVLRDLYMFSISPKAGFNHDMPWNSQWWGNVSIGDLTEV